MLKINTETNDIIEIYELKRSIISIEKWEPYRDDYNNFRLLAKLLFNTGINLKIAYNVRTKNPWNDDVGNIKLFNVSYGNDLNILYDKTVTLNQFLK